jgi:hypothetical protein
MVEGKIMGLFSKGVDEPRYLMLDEEDLKCLLRGGVLECDNIKIALRDIGFDRMNKALELAIDGINIGKGHTRKG